MSTFIIDSSSPPNPAFAHRAIGEIAATLPGATRLFRQYSLDFCCHGALLLGDAAANKGIDITVLEVALASLDRLASDSDDYPTETKSLISHLISRYHKIHRAEIPEFIRLARRVEAVHRQHPQAPQGLAETLEKLEESLNAHMAIEEEVLFPNMTNGSDKVLAYIIKVMNDEHEKHTEYLSAIECLTDHFTVPDEACSSWRALASGVQSLVEDVIRHVYLENSILFPRFALT